MEEALQGGTVDVGIAIGHRHQTIVLRQGLQDGDHLREGLDPVTIGHEDRHGLYRQGGIVAEGLEQDLQRGPAHGGDIMGYHSWGLYFPEKKVTFFGCVASDRGNGNDVMVAALTAMLGP